MKIPMFLVIGDFLVETGNPPPILRQNLNKVTVLYGCGFGSKKLGLGQPPPLVGTKSQLQPKIILLGSLYHKSQ